MIASWKIWFGLMSICLLQCRVVSQKVQLEPLSSTALRDSDVQFIATIQGDWEVTNWGVGGIQVLTIINSTNSIIPSVDRFSARFCVSTNRNCVEFIIHNVTRADAGEVVCNVQGHQPVTAQLFVQESGTVSIPGGNVTVMQGGEVELECVTTAWFPAPTISWTQNGRAVNSSLYNTTSTPDGDSFNSTSTVRLTASRNARVDCLASLSTLTAPRSSSVYIEIVPKPPDWTVLIAVVVSFGSCGLLGFLILVIVICYKHRKEKKRNYQDEMRRVTTHNQLSVIDTSEQVRGQVNEYYEPENQRNDTSDWTESGFLKHRHMTFV
ncbi:immunoglobulin superfamily member 5 [Xiphophorus hellerii]|uniref:immunoglobulin superfamily member 5 n=1 Tax=Xiphophorus hellerii TaxID=8084 RepID=UPI0013B3BC9C|nr:immunoglobulin superfamily member 5-like [Xiphophorus hellerii]XP_032431813.1 immunoglobulin superfamily member 5-like [Xiphophorus hellerii]